jgi:hypothetical protein
MDLNEIWYRRSTREAVKQNYVRSYQSHTTPTSHDTQIKLNFLRHSSSKEMICTEHNNRLGKMSHRRKEEHGKNEREELWEDGDKMERLGCQTTHIRWKCCRKG